MKRRSVTALDRSTLIGGPRDRESAGGRTGSEELEHVLAREDDAKFRRHAERALQKLEAAGLGRSRRVE